MRIATYNFHGCVGRDARFDPGGIAEVLVEIDSDVIALQEVTLNRVGEPTGCFEKGTDLNALTPVFLNVASDVATTCCKPACSPWRWPPSTALSDGPKRLKCLISFPNPASFLCENLRETFCPKSAKINQND